MRQFTMRIIGMVVIGLLALPLATSVANAASSDGHKSVVKNLKTTKSKRVKQSKRAKKSRTVRVRMAALAAAPAMPTGLKVVSAADGKVQLDWNDNRDNYIRYQVYRDNVMIANGPTASTYTDSGLVNGRVYKYRVSTGAAPSYSAWTAEVSATPAATPAPAPTPAPAAPLAMPTGLKVVSAADGKVQLDWADNTGAVERYQVYRDDVKIADGPTASAYTDSNLSTTRTYAYRVSAFAAGKYSEWTAVVSAKPAASTTTPPPPTTNPNPPTTPAPGGGGPFIWKGDFENGLSPFANAPWNYAGAPAPAVVSGLSRQGGFSGRFDVPGGIGRSELVANGQRYTNGMVRYFAFSVHLPSDFAWNPNWRVLAQWKNDGTGSPPLELSLHGQEWRLDGGWNGGSSCVEPSAHRIAWTGGAERGRWTDFVVGVKFQEGNNQGWVELFKNGQQVLQRTPYKTLYKGCGSYLKMGVYRSTAIGARDVVHHDNWRVGATYESVAG